MARAWIWLVAAAVSCAPVDGAAQDKARVGHRDVESKSFALVCVWRQLGDGSLTTMARPIPSRSRGSVSWTSASPRERSRQVSTSISSGFHGTYAAAPGAAIGGA